MTTAARFRWASLTVGIALFALTWSASDSVAALPPMEGAAQTGAISLDLGTAGRLALPGPSEGLCSLALPPREEERIDKSKGDPACRARASDVSQDRPSRLEAALRSTTVPQGVGGRDTWSVR